MKWRGWIWCQFYWLISFGRDGHEYKAARDDVVMKVSYCRRCGIVKIEEHYK